ncbi:aminotransferase class I/II-fold pyridoxal phosphate-dependent enzyme [Haliangium ochraceum]|uniref:Aminotransferase class I and II n=1 Tax=Haliangium ochraceum (strain DSM 14365 / JCM 11303 / SMP-2) TaxID=502025 RepID=D0LQ55_HALO1|nr:aminotransferase class I/II-fold pyridoxal phosphate-dependent enzyme [Haliangium ochraceum]ACY17092.1 aminotransferase class I and II [Haliangium ochraceum DSM 14365]
MRNPRLDDLPPYPFDRLRSLLGDLAPPPGRAPIALSIGEPQHPAPGIIAQRLAENAHLWNTYAPTDGTPSFRAAVADYLTRRYALPSSLIDPDRHVLPVAGTREALYLTGTLAVPPRQRGRRPVVLLPNPFYQAYSGAAELSDARPVYVETLSEKDFLPDIAGLDPDLLERAALVYVCSPSNPQGTVASLGYWKRLITLAREYDFVLAADECYADIYDSLPPPGALEAACALGGSLDNLLVFHSLSKRSSAAGLRSGFVAGDPELIARFQRFRSYACVAVARPILAASEALWSDEAHVEDNRRRYRRKLDLADDMLGHLDGFYRPTAGFFLWLRVGDGEATTRRLWAEAGLRVLPGSYLARDIPGQDNPGSEYIRVALVHPYELTREALERLADTLGG